MYYFFDHLWFGLIAVIFVGCIFFLTGVGEVYLGERGIKIKGSYIPKDKIIGYRIAEGWIGKVVFFIDGKDGVTVTFTRKDISGSVEVILDQYFT
ncbi:hypothetical protein [Paenibacillus radicibacter]|uniref:hypothetical protein n=1 Tax=Paenibacillus radicibacter TaxID=2972488 RepID=UPI0021596C34|nr:hypothetical protein [Paenibacillus radicibacter]